MWVSMSWCEAEVVLGPGIETTSANEVTVVAATVEFPVSSMV